MEILAENDGIRNEISVEVVIKYILSLLSVGSYTVCQLLRDDLTNFDFPSIIIDWSKPNRSAEDQLVPAIELGCSIFLVDQAVALEFLDVFTIVHDAALTRNPNKILILTGNVNENFLAYIVLHRNINDIQHVLAISWVENSLCILRIKSNSWTQIDECITVKPIMYKKSEIFPEIKERLNGADIKLETFELIPLMSLVPADKARSVYNNETYFLDGLDGRLVNGFCEQFNCTLEVSTSDLKYGKLYENGSADGMTGALLNRKVDVALAGIAAWLHLYLYFSYTSPMQPISVICLTPQTRFLSAWSLAIRIYKPLVWFLLLVSFAFIISFSFIILKISNLPHYLFPISWCIFGGLLLQPTNFRVRSIAETILSFALINFLFFLTNMYLAKASSMRTIPMRSASIDSVDQLADSGMPWYAPHDAWKFSIINSDRPSIKKLVQNFRALEPPDLLEKSNTGEESIAIAYLAAGHYLVGEWINPGNVELYRIMREEIYWEYEVVWTTKTWPMFDELNQFIMRVVEANLQRYEELLVAQRYLNYRVQTIIEHSRDRVRVERTVTKVEDVIGFLKMFVFGLLVSLVVFGFEIVFMKIQMFLNVA